MPRPPSPAPGTRGAGAATREHVLAVAERLFAERGVDGVSMSELAAAAGISKGNLFHHFPTKRALHLEVLRRACRDFGSLVEALGEDGIAAGDRLERFVHQHLELLRSRPDAVRLVLRTLLDGPPEDAELLAREVFGEHFSALVERLQPLLPAGHDAGLTAFVLVAANVIRFLAQPLLPHLAGTEGLRDPDRYARGLAALLGETVR
ncbi:MAG TPA: TetR/AcrR family transcriptional regulator [Chromatiales bacterium]|nr:TetR/AcrR family transcriptional regulator [Chromatiales bacterium]